MTAQLRDQSTHSVFSNWLRGEPSLDSLEQRLMITDVDFMVHKYMVNGTRADQYVMLLEEKCRMAWPLNTQLDTLLLLDMSMKLLNGKRVSVNNTVRRITYFGFHIVQFENTSPEDGRIFWNTLAGSDWIKSEVTKNQLIARMRFTKA